MNSLVLVGVLLAFASVVHAERMNLPQERTFGMALPGEEYRVPSLPKWTEPEKWAWTQICEGKEANFNKRLKEELDPGNPDHDDRWSDDRILNRILSSHFLETILLHDPFRSAIPLRGVRISGACFPDNINLIDASIERLIMVHKSYFKSQVDMFRLRTPALISLEGSKFGNGLNMDSSSVGVHLFMRDAIFNKVDLRGAKIGGQLSMVGSTFKGKLIMGSASVGISLPMRGAKFSEVDLRGAKIDDQLTMSGSTFKGKLIMGSISVGSSLIMRKAQFREVDLRTAKIGDQLTMSGSTFKGKLIMGSISVGSSLIMRKAQFREVDLRTAKIGDQISMDGSTFKDKLIMGSASVGGDLLMRAKEFGEVVLRGAEIGDQLNTDGATFKGKLDMNSASVGGSLFMRRVNFDTPANLTFFSVGSNLDVRGASLRGLDLTGSRIEGELRLGSFNRDIEWKGYKDESGNRQAPKLILRNTSVGTLQDTEDTWPDYLEREFEGFTYDRLGGFGASEHDRLDERGSSWFVEWLAKDRSYSPQPYRHLADVLRATGHEDMAGDILFAGREHERRETDWWPPKWLWLWILKLFIGYGYGLRYFYALYWIAGLTVFGTIFLCCAKESDRDGTKLGFWYSLDMLLPIIHLREQHYTHVDLKTRVKYYFYLHKIMGYVLISFVLAGLSGLVE